MSKKTQNLLDALRKNYPYPRYAFIQEFRGGTGWSVLNPIPIDKFFLASLMRLAAKEFREVIIDGRKYVAEKHET